MKALSDQRDRDRFIGELEQNFCVAASAGAGKTTAIVKRIVELARQEEKTIASGGDSRLSRLVVVTYGKLAAEELRVRSRQELFQNLRAHQLQRQQVLAAFNRAYFGTIHSFCLKLLQEEGRYLGLPGKLALLEEQDSRLWQRFVEQDFDFPQSTEPMVLRQVFRHYGYALIQQLARSMRAEEAEALLQRSVVTRMPELDLAAVLAIPAKGRSAASVAENQRALRRWWEDFQQGEGFLEIPKYDKGSAAFKQAYQEAMAPLIAWLNQQAARLAAMVALAYRDYRVSQGFLTYDDMIGWTKKLLAEPVVLRHLRQRNYVVILDEAQDTDPTMFSILVELTRPLDSELYAWPREEQGLPPEPGRFCFVGDEQQMIYSNRADLREYHQFINAFARGHGGEKLEFSVTMRCPAAVVATVNRLFPKRLAQPLVDFRQLKVRPGAPSGCLQILPMQPFTAESVEEQFRDECRQVGAWLVQQGLSGLGIKGWQEMAVLAPRVNWLPVAAEEFRRLGLPCRLISSKQRRADLPAYSWPLAVLQVLLQPHDRFELIGVLREIYAVADVELLALHRALAPAGLSLLSQVAKGDGAGLALAELRGLRDELVEARRSAQFSLGRFAKQLLTTTKLQGRLAAIGAETVYLDDFLNSALAAEAEGMELVDWVDALRRDLILPPPQAVGTNDEMQLLTCHKAKGLEWPVVLVLGLGRQLSPPSLAYPRLEKNSGEWVAHFNNLTQSDELKESRQAAHDQELQRLCYVMMTRARYMLIVPDSQGCYRNGKSSFAELLAWQELTWSNAGEMQAVNKESGAQAKALDDRLQTVSLAAALAAASQIHQRILPHQLAVLHQEKEPEEQALPDQLVGGMAYGTWWHGMLQDFPWVESMDNQEKYLQEQAALSPPAYRERAAVEIALFQRSTLRHKLCAVGEHYLAELPFLTLLRQQQENRDPAESLPSVMEGVIDLLVVDQQGACVVVDWKTNRRRRDESVAQFHQRLHDVYEPQLVAYGQCLAHRFKRPLVGCYLYATVSGENVDIRCT